MSNSSVIMQDRKQSAIVKATCEIVKPLFNATNTKFFHYERIYDNGTAFNMVTDHQWLKHLYKKKYMLTAPIPNNKIKERFYYLIPRDLSGYSECIDDFFNYFGYGYAVDIIHRYKDYYELFCFAGSNHDEQMQNYFLNHYDIFEKFILYFKDKGAKYLSQTKQMATVLPEIMRSNVKGLQYDEQEKYSDNHFDIKRYYINDKTYLTMREYDCLKQLALGYTVKEIAKIQKISPNTVEYFLNNIKLKAQMIKKSDLIQLYYDIEKILI